MEGMASVAVAGASQCPEEEGLDRNASAELASWRLLAALEAGTLLLVALALLLHALRARTGRLRNLRGHRVLISKGETQFSQELARQFSGEGCTVSLLVDRRAIDEATSPAPAVTETPHEAGVAVEVLSCDTRRLEEVKALAERVQGLDVLVICGAQPGTSLDDLADSVSEEVYTNFHLLEELGARMRTGGRAVWVSTSARAGSFAGASRSLQHLAHSLLNQVANKSGSRAVWCEARGESAGALAARVLRSVARDGCLPPSADVFRELGYKMRDVAYDTCSRLFKIWT